MIQNFFNSTLTRKRVTVNSLGKEITSTLANIPCRVELTKERQYGGDGESVVDRLRIYAKHDADIVIGDRITEQSGAYPEFAVRSVFMANGFGYSHKEISV